MPYRIYVIAAVLSLWNSLAFSQATLPAQADKAHLGVASCAGSQCHGSGAATPSTASVWLNEYNIWDAQDAHSNAYTVLEGDWGQRIAAAMGIGPATEAKICLDCHADNVAPDRRGEKFLLSDGVGCEACHGGSEDWLALHVADVPQEQLQAAGLYPTHEPVARAKLCLSCHYGTSDQFATHRIMAAGHPRLSFELDTFTAIQPAHFTVDDDYAARKKVWSGVQIWAIGQGMAVQASLRAILDPKLNRHGAFPELSLFDCHSCHHEADEYQWNPRPEQKPVLGLPRLNDANMLVLGVILEQINPALAKDWAASLQALHASVGESFAAKQAAAARLLQISEAVQSSLAEAAFEDSALMAMLPRLVDEGLNGAFVDYVAAEQAVMAYGTLITAGLKRGALPESAGIQLNQALEECYRAVEDEYAYRPGTFRIALQALKDALKQVSS